MTNIRYLKHTYTKWTSHTLLDKRLEKEQHRVDTEPKNRKSMDSDSKLTLLHERSDTLISND